MKKRWIIMMTIMVIFAVLGVVLPEGSSWNPEGEPLNFANMAWMITATIFVLMMTPGVSFFYGGMVRAKNVISTMLQSFIAMGVISVIWVVFGFSLAFGEDIGGFIGNPLTYFMFKDVGIHIPVGSENLASLGLTIPLALYALFQMKFAIITPSLITGSFAERVHFSGYLVFMMLWCIFVYCPLAHWTWHPEGFLGQMFVKDFAGGIVVHASSGVAALTGAIFLGRRKTVRVFRPANIAFARHVAVYLAMDMCEMTTPMVGAEFGGRDHSTLIQIRLVLRQCWYGCSLIVCVDVSLLLWGPR